MAQEHHQAIAMSMIAAARRARLRWYSPLASIALASPCAALILEDASVWQKYLKGVVGECHDDHMLVSMLISKEPAFRTLLYYRLCQCDRPTSHLLVAVLKRIWRPERSLRFWPDSLGPRCFILHGWETTVNAKSIGSDFILSPRVGLAHVGAHEYPTIGDHVRISVNSLVLGDVTIGDYATVGAGAVVVKDVAPGETVVGVPAHPVGSVNDQGARRAPEEDV
jgi:serine O-acetyltransferase